MSVTSSGIIGFFDILGYKTFLENNTGEAILPVLDTTSQIRRLSSLLLKASSESYSVPSLNG